MVLKKLTEILFCFRLNKIAMVADIEKKTFLQIGLYDCTRDVT